MFTLFVFVCVYWCPTHIVLCFWFAFFRLVYHLMPVSLDSPFLIALSVFSNVYLFTGYRFLYDILVAKDFILFYSHNLC
jgi:hypothetical protein